MTTRLVVADPARSKGTICLAVSPALKALGVKNRCRLFEIPPDLDYIIAEPRMQKYIDYSARIYGIYLRYIAPEDIHVYSVDEAFLDVTPYLNLYHMPAKELAQMLMSEVFRDTGIRATCGIGTNLYLAQIALDITAKHSADFIGQSCMKNPIVKSCGTIGLSQIFGGLDLVPFVGCRSLGFIPCQIANSRVLIN